MSIQTSPETPQLQRARSLLLAMACSLPLEQALPAAEALATLGYGVLPPLPPVDELPAETAVTTTEALEALAAAARVAADPQEAARIALSAETLTAPLVL